jgi:hypothetical protein
VFRHSTLTNGSASGCWCGSVCNPRIKLLSAGQAQALNLQMMKASSSTVTSPTSSNARATGSCSSQVRMAFSPLPFGLVTSLHKFPSQYSQHMLGIWVRRLGCDFLAL